MSALVEFAIFPTEKTQSKSAYVAQVIDLIDKSGVAYKMTPMGTIIETETTGEALALIDEAYRLLQQSCGRVYCAIKVDWREGPVGRLGKKVASVEAKLGRAVAT